MEIFVLGVILTAILSCIGLLIVKDGNVYSNYFAFYFTLFHTSLIISLLILAWELFIYLDVLQGIKTLFFL